MEAPPFTPGGPPSVFRGTDGTLFTLKRLLGSGASANVYACTAESNGIEKTYAVKIVDLTQASMRGANTNHEVRKLREEVELLKSLQHPNIVGVVDFVEMAGHFVFLVLEYVGEGELFRFLSDKSLRPNELEAKYVFCQIIDAVSFMHCRKILHRDLKAENVLVASRSNRPRGNEAPIHGVNWYIDIRIADFGLSKHLKEGLSKAKTFVGTPQYWAPEVIRANQTEGYDERADWWSCGVLLYVMLGVKYPFNNDYEVQNNPVQFSGTAFKSVSNEAKDLIQKLMRKRKEERISLVDCLDHPWLRSFPPAVTLKQLWVSDHRMEILPALLQQRSMLAIPENSAVVQPTDIAAVQSVADSSAPSSVMHLDTYHRETPGSVHSHTSGVPGRIHPAQVPHNHNMPSHTHGQTPQNHPVPSHSHYAHPMPPHTEHGYAPPPYPHPYGHSVSQYPGRPPYQPYPTPNDPYPPAYPAYETGKGKGRPGAGYDSYYAPQASPHAAPHGYPPPHPAYGAPAAWHGNHGNPYLDPRHMMLEGGKGGGGAYMQPSGPIYTEDHDMDEAPQKSPSVEKRKADAEKRVHEVVEQMVGDEFELKDLCRSQVEIAKAFQQAILAFRHDRQMYKMISVLFEESRAVQELSVMAVHKYAHTAQQVDLLLPDMREAVRMGYYVESVEILEQIKTWIADLQKRGKEVQEAYNLLVSKISSTLEGAQFMKNATDATIAYGRFASDLVPPSQKLMALDAAATPSGTSRVARDVDPSVAAFLDLQSQAKGKKGSPPGGNPAMPAAAGGGGAGCLQTKQAMSNSNSAAAAAAAGASDLRVLTGFGGTRNDYISNLFGSLEHYLRTAKEKRSSMDDQSFDNLVELTCLCPGMISLHTDFAADLAAPDSAAAAGSSDCVSARKTPPQSSVAAAAGTERNALIPVSPSNPQASQDSMNSDSSERAENRAARYLVSTLHELRRVEHILAKSRKFWGQVDETVVRLGQYKDHTAALLKMASQNQRMFARFEERVDSYQHFWKSLGDVCLAYAKDVRTETQKVYNDMLHYRHATDIIDSALALRRIDPQQFSLHASPGTDVSPQPTVPAIALPALENSKYPTPRDAQQPTNVAPLHSEPPASESPVIRKVASPDSAATDDHMYAPPPGIPARHQTSLSMESDPMAYQAHTREEGARAAAFEEMAEEDEVEPFPSGSDEDDADVDPSYGVAHVVN